MGGGKRKTGDLAGTSKNRPNRVENCERERGQKTGMPFMNWEWGKKKGGRGGGVKGGGSWAVTPGEAGRCKRVRYVAKRVTRGEKPFARKKKLPTEKHDQKGSTGAKQK